MIIIEYEEHIPGLAILHIFFSVNDYRELINDAAEVVGIPLTRHIKCDYQFKCGNVDIDVPDRPKNLYYWLRPSPDIQHRHVIMQGVKDMITDRKDDY